MKGLEEGRDELVIKWVRSIQGEVFKRVRSRVFEKKRERELINVAQRNFRKFLSMRDWVWFVIIHKIPKKNVQCLSSCLKNREISLFIQTDKVYLHLRKP